MLEIPIFDAVIWSVIGLSIYTLIIVPLSIRYLTPDTKENN